jgi:hypothetical protein
MLQWRPDHNWNGEAAAPIAALASAYVLDHANRFLPPPFAGVFNLAPCAIHAPGAAGEAFRIVGYHAFSAAVGGATQAERAWHGFEGSALTLRMLAAWGAVSAVAAGACRRTVGAAARLLLILRSISQGVRTPPTSGTAEHVMASGRVIKGDSEWGRTAFECWSMW